MLVILKYQQRVTARVSLEAMPQVTEEYSHMHPAKCSNFGTGVLTDFRTDALQRLALAAAILA
jgi:hypothetical protein